LSSFDDAAAALETFKVDAGLGQFASNISGELKKMENLNC